MGHKEDDTGDDRLSLAFRISEFELKISHSFISTH